MSRENLILTCASGYSWKKLAPFAVSFAKHVDNADCVCFIDRLGDDVIRRLADHNITTLPMSFATNARRVIQRLRKLSDRNLFRSLPRLFRRAVAKHSADLVAARNLYYEDFVSTCSSRRVFLTDMSDVVFQANPFNFASDDSPLEDVVQFFMEDGTLFGRNAGQNDAWVKKWYGDCVVAQLKGKVTSCAGTVLGSRDAILRYLQLMTDEISKLPYYAQYGSDQAVHNKILYDGTNALQKRLVANDVGLVLTVLNCDSSSYSLRGDGLVVNRRGSIIPVLHTYDRVPELFHGQCERLGIIPD
jgi:hypothetical protein